MTPPPLTRVKVPDVARKGEIITIKALASHPMENGLRQAPDGSLIPRKIIHRFDCAFNGRTVFSCDLGPSMSANPYLEFTARVEESGTFTFTWTEDGGATFENQAGIEIS